MANKPTYFPLTELIDELLKNGFIIGTDTYLHLHQLLDAIDIEEDYAILPQYLCPLFATNAKQQQKFYEIYNLLVELPPTKPNGLLDRGSEPPVPGLNIKPEKLHRSWLFYATASLGFVLIATVSFLIYQNSIRIIEQEKSTVSQQIEQQNTKKDSIVVQTKIIETEQKKIIRQKDSLNTTKPLPIEKEKEFKIRINNADSLIKQNQALIDKTNSSIVNQKTKQSELEKEEDTISYEFIRYVLLISILLLFVVYQIYQYLTRRLIAKRKHERKPPYTWNIRIKDQSIGLDSAIYSIANSMRFRTLSGVAKVDLKKTIDHTCKNGGNPNFQYTLNTKPIEYLMLIDWSNERNHQSQLFDYLYRTFLNNNVYIDRFYYDSDPRICWNEINNDGISLDKLQRQYPDAYLLVFGNGAGLIDPFTNSLYQYAGVFKEWERSALLTTEPSAHWGVQEVVLRNLFAVILPAISEGMLELTQHFGIKSGEASDLKDWKFNEHKKKSNIYVTAEYLETNQEIPQPLKVWIAACAVYPELYWDLTIAIGKKLETIGFNNLVTQENLALLSRIDWFRTGKIPDEERSILLQNRTLLPEVYKNTALATVIGVLEQNLTENNDNNSHAAEHFLMNIVVSKLMLTTISRKDRAELQKKLEQLRQTTDVQDFVALEYINNQKHSVTDFLLPPKFKKYFNNGGNKLFGLKNGIEYTALLLIMGFIFIFNNPLIYKVMPIVPVSKSLTINQQDTLKREIVAGTTKIFQVLETNSTVTFEMVFVKGGEFTMGNDSSEWEDEKPAHKVTVSDFYIGKYEVTQKQWTDIMGSNPSSLKGCDSCPVERVSWDDVQEFIAKLNAKSSNTYRLPTEAEWEYACRAGTTTPFNTGNNLTTSQANYDGNYPYNNNPKGEYRKKNMPVGSFEPNAWGLYDMHGNVSEWCRDWFGSDYYAKSPQGNPKGPSSGSYRVFRGGSWSYFAQYCRSAIRNYYAPGNRDYNLGFRLALVL